MVDMERGRPAHRRWFAAAAAIAVLVSAAGAVLVVRGSGDDVRPTETEAVDPGTTSQVVTPPATYPGDGSTEDALLPEGEPSSPPTSELVASITLFHGGAYRLYADGRLLWYDETRGLGPFAWREQRLTPDGIEQVRSRFLSSGLFDPARPSIDDWTCSDGAFRACVRAGDRWLVEETDPELQGPLPYGDPRPEAAALFSDLGALDSTLDAPYWADQSVSTHVPARIAMCLRMYFDGAPAPLDLPVLLSRLPTRAATLLTSREPGANPNATVALMRGGPSLADTGCYEMTTEEARTLADALLAPSGGGSHEYWGIVLRFGRHPDPTRPGERRREDAYVHFEEILPDGSPSAYFGG